MLKGAYPNIKYKNVECFPSHLKNKIGDSWCKNSAPSLVFEEQRLHFTFALHEAMNKRSQIKENQ